MATRKSGAKLRQEPKEEAMANLVMVMNMVAQGEDITTISQGATPVIGIGHDPVGLVCQIVNFLRCGCPAVQLFETENPGNLGEGALWSDLKSLILPGEMLSLSQKGDEFVWLVSRVVQTEGLEFPKGYCPPMPPGYQVVNLAVVPR